MFPMPANKNLTSA